jgi:thioredoxin 1
MDFQANVAPRRFVPPNAVPEPGSLVFGLVLRPEHTTSRLISITIARLVSREEDHDLRVRSLLAFAVVELAPQHRCWVGMAEIKGHVVGRRSSFADTEPSRAAIDTQRGPLVLEFGTAWCGHCLAAQPHITQALAQHPEITHLKIEDGPGRPLGRSFGVKLWPTLVFLNDGKEVERLVRPRSAERIADAIRKISPPG